MSIKRANVRRHLIAGLIVIAPISVTIAVLWWIFQALDGLLGQVIYPSLGFFIGREQLVIPGLGLLVLFLLLVGIGWLAERTIGSRIVAWWNSLLERIPLTRRIYGAANRIVRTVFGEESRPFKKVVLVEWPAPGRFSIGFLSAEAPVSIARHQPGAVSVFVPTTPNPTTGFLVIITPDAMHEIDMTVDEAFTFILSAGSVRPDPAARGGAMGTVSVVPATGESFAAGTGSVS